MKADILNNICGFKGNTSWAEVNLNYLASKEYQYITHPNPFLDPVRCDRFVKDVARRSGVDYTYGGFGENRSFIWRDSYIKFGNFVHLGIDVNVPVGTPVFCPVPFEVLEVFIDKEQNGGWGGRVLVKTEKGLVIFAHLKVVDNLQFNFQYQPIRLGNIAEASVNGGWFPHLHLQALNNISELNNLDGYGSSIDSVNKGDPANLLPPDAKILEDLGNNWVKVEIKGQKYIYRARNVGQQSGTEVLARINE
jgi:hypothetical protein